MKSPFWRALALISVSILVSLLMLEDAQAARRSGLAGNLQITDPDDVFIFPHHNIRYRDRMVIDMGPSGEGYNPNQPTITGDRYDGSATLIFGSEQWALNFSASRSDFLNGVAAGFHDGNDRGPWISGFGPLAGIHAMGPTGLDPFLYNWVDAGFAYALSSSELGLRVGVGRAAETTETTTGGTTTKQDDYSHVFHIQGSWGNSSTDIAAEVAFGSSNTSNTDPANLYDLSGSYSEFAAGLRHYMSLGGYDWTLLAAFAHGSDDADQAGTPVTTFKDTATNWMVGFGPVWRDAPETWQAAAHIYLAYQQFKENPPGDNNDTTDRTFVFPGFVGSMEYVHGRLAVRGGARSYYGFNKEEAQGATTTTETRDRNYIFLWTAGASLAIGDNFLIDMALNEQKILDGPSFLGAQNGEPLFAMVSATLNWGGGGE